MNIMSKWNLSSLLFLSLAIPTTAAQAWEGSLLLGISGGFAERDGEISTTIFHPPPGSQISTLSDSRDGNFDSGYLWGFLAGYEITNNAWVLGLEFNLDWQDKRHTGDDNLQAFTDSINQGWVYAPHYKSNAVVGLTSRLGYQVFSNFIPYIRLGVEFSDNKLTYSALDTVNNLFVAGDAKRHMTRILGGAGVEAPLPFVMIGLSLRMEYNYHSRGTVITAAGIANDFTTAWFVDAHASTQSVKASLVWNLPF